MVDYECDMLWIYIIPEAIVGMIEKLNTIHLINVIGQNLLVQMATIST